MANIQELLKFISLLSKFQAIERTIRIKNQDRWENDLEHSAQLAYCAWYIINSEKLELDVNKCLMYALAHDFVEIYAGDTYAHSDDVELLESKPQREAEAAEELRKILPEFPELHEYIHAYEGKEDNESKFIYALDKLLPTVNVYQDGGRTWKEKDVTLQMSIDIKKDKVKQSPIVEEYFNQLIAIISKEEPTLFSKHE